jgi:hypothetical protein
MKRDALGRAALVALGLGSIGAAVDGSGLGAFSVAASSGMYASATGTGTACTYGSPCSLSTLITKLSTAGQGTGYLRSIGGVYRQASTLALTSANSGSSGHTITIQNAPGDAPVISGAIAVTGWTSCASGCPSNTPSTAIYKATVPSTVATREIYVGGWRATRATGYYYGTWGISGGTFTGANTVYTWPDIVGVQAEGLTQWRWFECPVVSATSSTLNVASTCYNASQSSAMGGVTFGQIYWLENALELLTQPGMWYFDEAGENGAADTLYYWPRPLDNMATADVEFPILETVASMTGVSNFTFGPGITIAGGTYLHPNTADGFVPIQGAYAYQTVGSTSTCGIPLTSGGLSMCSFMATPNISIQTSTNVSFVGNAITEMGGIGLALWNGSQNDTVNANAIWSPGAAGLQIGDISYLGDYTLGGPRQVESNTVTNNYVFNAGDEYWSAPGIETGLTLSDAINNNEVLGGPYDGVMIGDFTTSATGSWALNTYSNNLVQWNMWRTQDGANLYTIGAMASGLGDVWSGNVTSNGINDGWGPYIDNNSSYKTGNGNVYEIDGTTNTTYLKCQTGGGEVAVNNTLTATYSNQSATSPSVCDSSNSFAAPTAITNIHSSLVAAIYAASGANWRTLDISYGKTATASSNSSSAGNAVDGSWATTWTSSDAAPYWQVNLGAVYAVDTVEIAPIVITNITSAPPGQQSERRSYAALVGNDPTFASYSTCGFVDSSGQYWYNKMASFACSPALSGQYVRLAKHCYAGDSACTTNETFGFSEVRIHGQ